MVPYSSQNQPKAQTGFHLLSLSPDRLSKTTDPSSGGATHLTDLFIETQQRVSSTSHTSQSP